MREPYKGSQRKIVFAFDVGTTQTGISYCVLEPGEIPQNRSMHKFPGQELVNGSYKIPTVMYYDKEGKMVSAGAETLAGEVEEKAEEEGWMKVEWFKLRLRPKNLPFAFYDADLGPLPPGKIIDDVFADFYGYLLKCCESFINEVHPTYSCENLLKSAEFILCHPNGWKGSQQDRMRRAAIKASLIPNTNEGRNRIRFVTEGEASLHYCIDEHHLDDNDEGLIVADLGGGTLDFSAYNIISRSPVVFHESAPAKCALEGSEIITKRARQYLAEKLKGSKYATEDDIDEMVKIFDQRNKRVFRSSTETMYIQFGRISCKDPKFGIMGGKLKLSGDEFAKFYEPSITAAVKSITQCVLASPVKISAVYIVGGLSGSIYFKSELQRRFAEANFKIRAPSDSNVKAAALGALCFNLDHYVQARVAKASYGIEVTTNYDATLAEHTRRKANSSRTFLSGLIGISGKFDTILHKGTVVHEDTKFEREYFREIELRQSACSAFSFTETILSYIGSRPTIDWLDEISTPDELQTTCHVKGDLSALRSVAVIRTGVNGVMYQDIAFRIVLHFGGPELKAQLHWFENGKENWGPVTIIYGDDRMSPGDSNFDALASV